MTTATSEGIAAAMVLDSDELERHVFQLGQGNATQPWLQSGQVLARGVAGGWWLVYGPVDAETAAQVATTWSSSSPPPEDQWKLAQVQDPATAVFTWHQPECDGGPDCDASCYNGERWWVTVVPPGTPGAVEVVPVRPVPYHRPSLLSRLAKALPWNPHGTKVTLVG